MNANQDGDGTGERPSNTDMATTAVRPMADETCLQKTLKLFSIADVGCRYKWELGDFHVIFFFLVCAELKGRGMQKSTR